jgi:hypothetical protein
MPKVKMFSGTKRCSCGERYNFRKGIAVVPGVTFSGKPLQISIHEFINLMQEISDDKSK